MVADLGPKPRRTLALLAALSLFGVGSGVYLVHPVEAGDLVSKGVDALDQILNRSPGERGGVRSVKDRVAAKEGGDDKTARRVIPPRDKVLGKVFDVAPGQNPLANPQLVPDPAAPTGVAAPASEAVAPVVSPGPIVAPIGPLVTPSSSGGSTSGGGTSGGGTSSGGTSSGGTSSGGSSSGGPINQIPAVPEPQVWAMMLIGFGVIGYRLRQKPHGIVRTTV